MAAHDAAHRLTLGLRLRRLALLARAAGGSRPASGVRLAPGPAEPRRLSVVIEELAKHWEPYGYYEHFVSVIRIVISAISHVARQEAARGGAPALPAPAPAAHIPCSLHPVLLHQRAHLPRLVQVGP